jgi:coiled-coil domain-containing protein 39
LEQIQESLNTIQNTIYTTNQKLDEFKLQMNWNQTELEQWILATKQKEEDSNIIAKYSKIDEQKIKELSFELEKLTKELLVHKENLDNEIIETQAKQLELDRIAIDFKTAHDERKDLIQRWQDIINEMKKRDVDINLIGEKFAAAKNERNHREQLVIVQRDRLTAQLTENKAIESKFESLSRIVVKKREELIAGSLKLQEFRDELESLKNILTASAESLVLKRKANTHKAQLVEDRKAVLEKERVKYQQAKEKLEFTKLSTTQVEVSAKQAEDILQQKEKQFVTKLSHVKEAKDKLFKESQNVYELKREETRLQNEVCYVVLRY